MWPDNRLTALFGIAHPIVQAPMAGSSIPDLAAAVGNAGGLGSLGCGSMNDKDVRLATNELRAKTNAPFNLNFFAHTAPPPMRAEQIEAARSRLAPWYRAFDLGPVPEGLPDMGPGFDVEKLELVLDLRPAVVSFHFGLPDREAVQALKGAGIVLISSATNVAEARALEAAGVDAIIAQGWEAGGHRGSHVPTDPCDGVGTIALVPQVVDAVDVPVIAAGGIGDGRGIAAAFALGASGVQIGTGFLSCPEAATDPRRRELLRSASDQDTMVTKAISGRSARAVKSPYATDMARTEQDWLVFPATYMLTNPILKASEDAGSDDVSFHLYGQAAALNRELPAGALLERLVVEAREAFGKLAG